MVAGGILATAAAATYPPYSPTLWYGFHYDDYYFIKPYTRDEVLATFAGSWDHSGIMVPFYRPLTIAFFALRFELFGLNAVAHHAVSLTLFASAAALAGLLAWRMTRSAGAGMLAALMFSLHPAMPYAQAVWITNQMHLLSSVVVLSALLWGHVVAHRPLLWWLPLLGFAAAAFLVKEDNIMLLPAIVALHWLRRRLAEPVLQKAPRAFVAIAALLAGGLVILRQEALGGLGGYGRPTPERAWTNFKKGITGVFWLLPADRPWQPFASRFAMLLPIGALAFWRRISAGTRFLVAGGTAIGLLFNLPFVFVSKFEQMHLVAAGASLLMTGSIIAILEALRARSLRIAAMLVCAAGIAACAFVAREISRDFEPFGTIAFSYDEIVRDWAAVPQEIRQYLRRKPQPDGGRRLSANPVDEVRLVGFGLHPPETSPDGINYRWMAQSRAELLVAAGARDIVIPLRHDAGAFREAAHVTITLDGHRVEQLTLPDGSWRTVRYALRRADVPRLSGMHRLVVEIPHAWVPSRIIPGSNDGRVLGLQIGDIQMR